MMKSSHLLFFLFMTVFIHATEPQKVVFAPLPALGQESIFKTFAPMVHYLEKTLHVSIHFHFTDSYEALLEDIKSGVVDIAYLGPLPYVKLKESFSFAQPLVFFNEADGKPHYRCVLVAWGDAFEPLSRLNPYHSFALTDPLSTCGYLAVSGVLRDAGYALEEQPFSYLGKHDAVALSVVKGRFDYGGVKEDVARTYAHLGLSVVAQTEFIPSFALVANTQKLSSTLQKEMTEALLNAPPSEFHTWGKEIRAGVSVAHDDAYTPVRIMRLENIVSSQGAIR